MLPFRFPAVLLVLGMFGLPASSVAQMRRVAGRAPSANVPVAPVPADPHELVTGGAVLAATPSARSAALALFERAKQNNDLHIAGTAPFYLKATFTTAGYTSVTGPGELTETWLSGGSWRWTASLGSYSQVRLGAGGTIVDAQPVTVVPMRVQTLRSAIFWPARQISNGMLRTASVAWNGRPATCLLSSRSVDPNVGSRQWVEEEYCVDDATGLLQIHSPAPGAYIVYGYGKNMLFHDRVIPDHVTAYIAGAAVIDAQLDISDAGNVSPSEMTPTQEMLRNGPAIELVAGQRFPAAAPGPAGSEMVLPVIVHATIAANGKVAEEEVASAAEPALAQAAINVVKGMAFGAGSYQRETYVNVRFVPPGQ